MNNAIDQVARQMTDGAPADAAAFRRRVLARIEAGDAPRRSWRAAFVLSPIAVAAAIVIAAFVMRGRIEPPAPATVAHRIEQGPPPRREPSTAVGTDPAPPQAASSKGPALPAASTNAGRRPSLPRPGTAEAVVEPAPPVNSIAVAPLVVDTLTPESIAIPRLDIVAPMMVAPLDIPDAQRREP